MMCLSLIDAVYTRVTLKEQQFNLILVRPAEGVREVSRSLCCLLSSRIHLKSFSLDKGKVFLVVHSSSIVLFILLFLLSINTMDNNGHLFSFSVVR